jgi:hypothetical protein
MLQPLHVPFLPLVSSK